MKKFIASFFILVLLVAVSTKKVFAEQINRFDATVQINKNGFINVSEKIQYDFGTRERHGIFRTIPSVKKNTEGKSFRLDIQIKEVVDEKGMRYGYVTATEDNYLKLKIGDANRTITGIHTYIISYVVSGALTYFSDHDELYWNVTGNEWQIPITYATATLEFPANFTSNDIQLKCFTGASGSKEQACTFNTDGGKATFTSRRLLDPYEGMTVVIGFPKNIVAVLEPKEVAALSDTLIGKVGVVLLIISALLWYLVYPIWLIIKWYRFGRDPKEFKPVSAWFDPPKAQDGRLLSPAETGTLIDEQVHLRDITATVVDLARRGYLTIYEEKKNDFSLIKKKDFLRDTSLLPFERRMLEGLFAPSGTLPAVRLKNGLLYNSVEDVKKMIYKNMVLDGFFPEDPNSVRRFYNGITVLALISLNPLLVLSSVIFGRSMSKRTLYGAEQLGIAKSLRNFLASQERQLAFQADKQIMFEKLLPYAVAFSVEKIWAERFKDIDLKQVEWYSSYRPGSFNSINFVSALSSSMTSFVSAATPISSSSGFSSGFSSGGGSSGGGGGGGGGGSW